MTKRGGTTTAARSGTTTRDTPPASPNSTDTREIPLARLTDPNHPQYGGRNLLEIMWEPIDLKMDELMAPDLENSDRAEIVGFLRGACTMYATFLNVYIPDVEALRRQAMKRWKYRHYKSEVWK